jgi:peptidoglycan L-alanyl-D-glutamate endopeptidase CwlK
VSESSFNKRTSDNLKEVHPDLVRVWVEVQKTISITVIEGKRSKERQVELFARGASKKTDGKHCAEPLSLATDTVPSDFDWSKSGDWKELRKLYFLAGIVKKVSEDLGVKVRWGGDWDSDNDFSDQTFNDLVHFELA